MNDRIGPIVIKRPEHMTEQTAVSESRRRWQQFSLRTLIVIVTVSAFGFAWLSIKFEEGRRRRQAITEIEKMGGGVVLEVVQPAITWWRQFFAHRFPANAIWIVLSNRQTSDLSPLAELKNVKQLSLNNTQVSDLSPLAELKHVQLLFLHNTEVSDLSPLAELKNLEILSLDNTQVSDLSPLANLKSLKALSVKGTPVSDEQVATLKEALPKCVIDHQASSEQD